MLQSHEIYDLIDRMALTVRTLSDGPPQPLSYRPREWWVLVQGARYNPLDYDQRMEAREGLRERAASMGVVPEPYVWVWDDSNRAQLVAGSFTDLAQAEEMSRMLISLGLTARLIEARRE